MQHAVSVPRPGHRPGHTSRPLARAARLFGTTALAAALVATSLVPGQTAPAAAAPVVKTATTTTTTALDAFGRTVSGGWGTAQNGGAWSTIWATHSVAPGAGRQLVGAGKSGFAYLEGYSSTATDLRIDVALDKAATGGGTYVSVLGRRVGTSGDYRARLKVQSTGVVALVASRGETTLTSANVPGVTYKAGTKLSVRLQVTGTSPTTIRAKAWPAGTTEPTDWLVSTTDGTLALQKAGSIGLGTYVSSSATSGPVTASFSKLSAVPSVANAKPTATVVAAVDDLTATFDGSASKDVDGSLTGYLWQFGDGTTATTPVAQHVYTAAGTYTASLTVTDDDGATATSTATVTAVKPNVAPVARVAASVQDLTVAADGSASADPDGQIAAYTWTFGDGTTSTLPEASHTYAAAGTYPVTLTATDNRGAKSSSTSTVTATRPNVAPVARSTASAKDLTVTVDGAASSDSDGTVTSYAWSFGDGSTGSGATAQHTYAAAGTYTVTLTVTDDRGATSTSTSTVTAVKPNVAPVARLSVTAQDLTVTADGAASTDEDGSLASYTWSFGDGSTATGATAQHTYAAAGTYTTTLTVVDDAGALTSASTTTTVTAKVVAAPGAVKPGAGNTGVPAGTTLKVHRGDLVITTPGTVIDGLDIYGFVTVKAANVTIKNSRVRGSGPGSFNTGLINANHSAVKNLLIQDVTLVPDYPSVWINGVLGHDFTARRVNTYNVVDGFGIYNINGPAANAVVESSWVHDLSYFSPDPNHSDNQTHNDAIQIQGGTNITIVGNYLSAYLSKSAGTQNYKYPQAGFGVILTPNVNAVSGSKINNNWLDGSYIPIKLTTGKKGPMNFGQVNNNRFARDMRNTPMNGVNQWFTILMTPDMTAEPHGNDYVDNGTPITVRYDSGTSTAP